MDNRDTPKLPRLHTGPMRIVGQKGGDEKKPWDARQWLREHTGQSPRRARKPEHDGKPSMMTVTVQAIVCGFIILAVLIVKALNLPQTQETLAGLNTALTTETDIDKSLGKLKFVSDLLGGGSQAVFNPETQGFVPPLDNMAIETGGVPQYVISVDVGAEPTPVLAAADGEVFYAGASADYGTLVIIRHQDGYETWYGGIKPEVKAGHTALAGERIGTIQNAVFKFLAFEDGSPLDPRPYIKKAGE